MERDPEQTFDFLARTYRVVRVIALGVVSLVGVLVTVIALDVRVSDRWTTIQIPLYVFTIVAVALILLLGVPAVIMSVLLRESIQNTSYFRSKAAHLEDAVRGLESLAYNDPITGIPNSNALKRELEWSKDESRRCLILLDLNNFGSINKRFDHWTGDEYLRRFSEMVSKSGRRNEFLFKLRPDDEDETPTPSNERAKTFRKNTGGDEFYVLLEGTVLDGLGYLSRLQREKSKFEVMSMDLLGEDHPFGFTAGVIALAPRENYGNAIKRVSRCQALTRPGSSVYWYEAELQAEFQDRRHEAVLQQAVELFGDPRAPRKPERASSTKGQTAGQ